MTKKDLEILVSDQEQVIAALQTGISQFIESLDTMMKQSHRISPKDIGTNLSAMVTELEEISNSLNTVQYGSISQHQSLEES